MANLKPKTECVERPEQLNGRRSFIWKAGAAMSAVVASTIAGFAKPVSDRNGSLKESNAVRRLHRGDEAGLDEGEYEEVLDLFDDKAEVIFNGGSFSGKNRGIRRLYCDLFRSGTTGRKIEPPAGFGPDPAKELDIVEMAADSKTATGRFPYSMQVGTPIEGDSSLVQMARLQGEGIEKWWEGGVCEASYVKVGNKWKIKRLEYRVTAKADYKPGRSYAKPISVPSFTKTYPENPAGPDKLITST